VQYAAHIFNEEIDQLATIIVRVLPSRVVRGRRNPLYFGLPARLKEARENWSFDSVALAAGLSDGNTIFQLERKRGHVPRLDTVEKIALALGLSPAFLAYGIEADARQPTDGLRCEGVASRLRETRTDRGLTMRALARAAGLTDTAVRSTETGASMPSIATVESFAVALGVSPAWLAYGLGPMVLPGRRRAAVSPAPSPG
jgi:transcriptional regulator with XRE-family HTH domain